MSMEKIGFIGMGNMGRPMATRLASKGYDVRAYDIRPEASQGLEEVGILWAGSIREITQTSSVLITMVLKAEQVREIILGSEGILETASSGTVVLEMTSSDPAVTREVGLKCAEKEILLIDAPVSGGVEAARKGTLTIMVGGEEEAVDRVRPVLMAMGKTIVHMGSLGSGHAMKLMNNFISATTLSATAEVVALACKAGISAERVVEVLQTSTGTSDAVTRKFPQHIFPNEEIGFTIDIMQKDVKTYLQFAQEMGIPTFVSSSVYNLWNLHTIEGRGQQDAIHFVEPYERWCGSQIRGITKKNKEVPN